MYSSLKNLTSTHLLPEKVHFSLFTTEEMRKMCVTKIVTPLTLDAMGYPLPGGLYDTRLGPLSDKSPPCSTCNKTMTNCPGHFGYIELPLPATNPLFHKLIGSIMRMSCLSCFHIQIPSHVKHCISLQMKLLSAGLVTLAMEVESKILELVSEYKSYENIPENVILPITNIEREANEALEHLNGDILSQNTETLRNQILSQLLKDFSPKELCMYCKKRIEKVKVLKNRIIVSSRKLADGGSGAMVSQRIGVLESKYMNPEESRENMRNIWKEEKDFLLQFVSVLGDIKSEHPTDVFYLEIIPVPPANVRPINIVKDRVLENKQSEMYKKILQNVILLRAIIQVVQKKGDQSSLTSAEAKAAYSYARGNTAIEKLNNAWEELQTDVNCIVDRETTRSKESEGLKQIIEKKEGIIRMNMMGKRVNFSARSVITPDPNLNIDEIGVPEEFAKKLTYPVVVTPWNVEEMRKMIMNGPNVHPGAVMVEYNGTVKRINPNNKTQQKSILKCLLTPENRGKGAQNVKIVHRHLCNGDVLLLNRQPTLHKPSIMAHKARILRGEKTLRLHYANCKAYNADFDGDEMNAHFPQNELARSEGYNIANVSNQYLVPKDGTPLSGLIQDHMISGVRLSLRGRFFSKDDYQQLVYQALSFRSSNLILLPPAIIKPMTLWSGKQVLSTVIINIIPKGRERINLTATAKIPAKAWQSGKPRAWQAGGSPFTNYNDMSEAEVIIRGGELLVGILDKMHYGATPYGLVHCMYELYGGTCATQLLSSLAKLFMRFLQQEGFTLGVHDILTVRRADRKRKQIIRRSREIGVEVVSAALGLPGVHSPEEIAEKIEEATVTNPKIRAVIDRHYKSALDSYTNDINKTCLPAGLVCKFPQNNLQLMVQSGAKGSTVNTMQISCLLGQIELEGKRPPVMISGKSLPSFPAFEFTPRAGGFIDGRFMTGIQPQEFFFHCMAGREGLIDTAVKTSRSGYLQRCLIKHLEGLHVAYDMTVRNSDNSVVQFLYGEDGMDIMKAQFFNEKQLRFLSENTSALAQREALQKLKEGEEQKAVKEHLKQVTKWKQQNGDPLNVENRKPFTIFSTYVNGKVPGKVFKKADVVKMWRDMTADVKDEFKVKCKGCPDPIASVYQPDSHYGSINERLEKMVKDYKPPKGVVSKKEFRDTMKLKIMQSMCSAGEPVGLLAAQSVGEPSTQMTLNTFHFAGRGEMNVTLGIPRLREILMMASKNIKTPSMEIPFLNVDGLQQKAELLRRMLTRVTLADVLETIEVSVELLLEPVRQHQYTVRFNFLPERCYTRDYYMTPKKVIKHVKQRFFGEMFAAIRKFTKVKTNMVMMEDDTIKRRAARDKDEDNGDDDEQEKSASGPANDGSSSEDEVEDEEDAKTTNKYQQVHEKQEPDEEEKEASDEEYNSEEEEKPNLNEKMEQQDNTVVEMHRAAQNYKEDKLFMWCEITFALPLNFKKLDLSVLLREAANKSVLWQTPNIKRAITYLKDDQLTLRTDGINIVEMFKYRDLLDLNNLYCNDIHKMAETYGIEAASKIIVKEVKDVFNVYGIKVDPRHLSLIADYMTFNGTFEPLSRKGMESSASPLQQISFESSLVFLKNATLRGKDDDLQNPSSSLMVGKPCRTGTGCFTLMSSFAPPYTVK